MMMPMAGYLCKSSKREEWKGDEKHVIIISNDAAIFLPPNLRYFTLSLYFFIFCPDPALFYSGVAAMFLFS